MPRTAIAICAAIALGAMDLFLMSVAFLYRPAASAWMIGFVLIAFAVALLFRVAWLVFVAQNLVTAVLLYRAVEYSLLGLDRSQDSDVTSLIVLVGVIVLCNILAWLIARALPMRRTSAGVDDDHSAASR